MRCVVRWVGVAVAVAASMLSVFKVFVVHFSNSKALWHFEKPRIRFVCPSKRMSGRMNYNVLCYKIQNNEINSNQPPRAMRERCQF